MLKLGIVSSEQLEHPLTWLGKRKHANLLLLRELFEHFPEDSRHHDTVITQVITPNGTWKTTRKGRFELLDRLVLEVLRERWAGTKLSVIDLGVSNGATSVDFYETLASAFAVEFLATDLWRDAIAVHSLRRGWTVVFDAAGHALQHVIGPFVLPGQGHESALYPINRALRALSRRLHLPRAAAAFHRYDAAAHADFETTRMDDYEITKLLLLSGEFLRLQHASEGVRFQVADVLRPLPCRADVIRAMNVLTPTYFDEARLCIGIRNCIAAVNLGGMLILGRSLNDDPRDVKATIYMREGRRLRVVRSVNGGYEAGHLVEAEARAADWPSGSMPAPVGTGEHAAAAKR